MNNYKSLILEDYVEWMKLNSTKKFSLFDYINGVIQLRDLPIDVFVAVLKLFWPDFINFDNKIFIKEEFSEEKYRELIDNGCPDKDLEYWMNLINVDGLFHSESLEVTEYLSKYIEYLWEKN